MRTEKDGGNISDQIQKRGKKSHIQNLHRRRSFAIMAAPMQTEKGGGNF